MSQEDRTVLRAIADLNARSIGRMEHRFRAQMPRHGHAGGRTARAARLRQHALAQALPWQSKFLGEGLKFEELLPIEWIAGPLPQGLELARLNADNHQLLGAESTLDEARVSEALSKEESSALVHELQRLEYKLNILLG